MGLGVILRLDGRYTRWHAYRLCKCNELCSCVIMPFYLYYMRILSIQSRASCLVIERLFQCPNYVPRSHHIIIQCVHSQPNTDLQIHLIPTQNPITLNTIPATMTTITLVCPSNASLTSNLATFLIFLLRCQLFLPFRPSRPLAPAVPSSSPSLGAMASFGSTCAAPPRRLHVEFLWSWYGSGSSQEVGNR